MGFAIPLVEINHAALLNEPTVAVVDPMAREATATSQFVLRRSICANREGQSCPRDGGIDLEVRLAPHTSRRGHSGTPAGRLRKAHPAVPHFGVLQCWHRDCRNRDLLRSELEPGQPDAATSRMTVIDDLGAFDLDPRSQLVRLTEEIASVHRLDLVDPIRRRVVVVSDAERKWKLRQPLNRLRGNPGNGGDRRLDPHRITPLSARLVTVSL